ncbi:MAG: hypothetical protein ACT4PV_08755 [Planctomycetaceae bacterium]
MRLALLAPTAFACALLLHADEAPHPDRAWPGGGRAELSVPDDLWERARAATVGGLRALGYSGDEMRGYGGRAHLLRTVENLFRDVRSAPREAGRITDELLLLGAEGRIDELLQRCWTLVDVPAGRNFPAVPGDAWGVSWLEPTAGPIEAFGSLVRGWRFKDPPPAPDQEEWARFASLPILVQRLVTRLCIGAMEGAGWLAEGDVAPASDSSEIGSALRQQRMRPWLDEEFGQAASRAHSVFESLARYDAPRAAYASVIFAAHLKRAVEEWRAANASGMPEGRWVFASPLGPLVVSGSGDDQIDAAALPGGSWLVLDLGGCDRWQGGFGASFQGAGSVAVAVDLAGDDVWDGGDAPAGLGCGFLGIGALLDLGGNDRYTITESGLGCGWFGTGLLWDFAGDDTYVVKTRWGQGAAHAGVGVLLDLAGNDRYECAEQSQGMGATLGCGLLLDLAGNDVYWCRDDGNVSELYLGQSVAMAQGCGYGRRADLGDGRSLAGGWGLLVDGAGNDRYHAQCWAQGCAYWWGVGVLEDRSGDDVYENGKYSLGAAAHFAIGLQVDLAGDDRYNVGIATTKNQFQGHARDGSIGISIDGDGNDRYALKSFCAGCADLGSLALFWDRRGDDLYEAAMEEGLGETGPFGTATVNPPFRSYRDDLPAVGIFLDTGGADTYRGDPRGEAGAREGARWGGRRAPNAHGYGEDLALYR